MLDPKNHIKNNRQNASRWAPVVWKVLEAVAGVLPPATPLPEQRRLPGALCPLLSSPPLHVGMALPSPSSPGAPDPCGLRASLLAIFPQTVSSGGSSLRPLLYARHLMPSGCPSCFHFYGVTIFSMERLSCLFETIFVMGKLVPSLLKIVKICFPGFSFVPEVGHNNPLVIQKLEGLDSSLLGCGTGCGSQ